VSVDIVVPLCHHKGARCDLSPGEQWGVDCSSSADSIFTIVIFNVNVEREMKAIVDI
jgi:hypothetical protein